MAFLDIALIPFLSSAVSCVACNVQKSKFRVKHKLTLMKLYVNNPNYPNLIKDNLIVTMFAVPPNNTKEIPRLLIGTTDHNKYGCSNYGSSSQYHRKHSSTALL